jgi:hypothetical protein
MYIQIYKYVTLFVKQKTQFLGLSNCICPNRFIPSIYHFYVVCLVSSGHTATLNTIVHTCTIYMYIYMYTI